LFVKAHSDSIAFVLFNSTYRDPTLHPFLGSIASRIRLHRASLPNLGLLEFDSDLLNVKGQLDGEDLFINNELHCARGIRKLHLETARFGSGLEILHCVFFPEPSFDIPIFGVDIVSANQVILAAIVDLSPVAKDLPNDISKELARLVPPCFGRVRCLPEWGTIFSKYVQFIRPEGRDEEEIFVQIVDDYLKILVGSLSSLQPDLPDSGSTIERLNYQKIYCLQQKRNDKTRNVLAKAFNPQWADRYIDTLLFESPSSL